MKKLIVGIMSAVLTFTFFPAQATTATEAITTSAEAAKAEALLGRLQEIKAMDAAALSAPEKTELKKEVRSIKQQLKDVYGGVYLSAGAIILILILLIILT